MSRDLIKPSVGAGKLDRHLLPWVAGVLGCAAVLVGRAKADEPSIGSATISPSNDLVAFNRCRMGEGCFLGIHVITTEATYLIEKPRGEDWFNPVFSPDGQQIAFSWGVKGAWLNECDFSSMEDRCND